MQRAQEPGCSDALDVTHMKLAVLSLGGVDLLAGAQQLLLQLFCGDFLQIKIMQLCADVHCVQAITTGCAGSCHTH